MDNNIPIGYKAICEKLNLQTLPHYRTSYITKHGRGKTIIDGNYEIHFYPKYYALQNENDLFANLEFALKYDGINLEIIKAFFKKIDKNKIIEYIQNQPTSIYSRKIWYLYEFLMAEQLNIKDIKGIKYIDLLDSKIYFTGPSKKSSRHAVNDNLLGNNKFCPIVRRTITLKKFINLQLNNEVAEILKKYDPHLILRASTYLYTKETMSSYQIEKEQPDKNRLARFISLLQQSHSIESLSKEKLIELQNNIVDPRFKDVDYRHTQNYVGENITPHYQKIHYISPKPEDITEVMQGILEALNTLISAPIDPVVLATAISFAFVFAHPFEDGNGRIHRFLIHYILSKMEYTPKNIIFPVSSVMLKNLFQYDQTLESFSKPLLTILTNYTLSNIGEMKVTQDSESFYQYIDFTVMAEYLYSCIQTATHDYIEKEIQFLLHYDQTKKLIQEIVDMPDKEIDLFIKFIMQNNGKLASQKRNKYFSLLTNDEINQLTKIVRKKMMK